jgi:DNA-binding transcriptional regulator YiaG
MAKMSRGSGRKGRTFKPKAQKATAAEPMKYREVADKVAYLRIEILDLKQSKFAEAAHVAQSRIVAWEKGAERPSPEAFLQLGRLANNAPDLRDWFWQQAGGLLQLAEFVGEQRLRKRSEPLPKGRTIEVPCLRRVGRATEGTELTWPVKADLVTDQASTYCLLIGRGTHSRYLRPGDAVVVDESSRHGSDLRPFQDEIVLVDMDLSKPRRLDPDGHLIHWPDGLCIGRLRIKTFQPQHPIIPIPGQRGPWQEPGVSFQLVSPLWVATLTASDEWLSWEPGDESLYLGEWQPNDEPSSMDPKDLKSQMDAWVVQAPGSIRLEEACSILGRVVDWYPSAGSQSAKSAGGKPETE